MSGKRDGKRDKKNAGADRAKTGGAKRVSKREFLRGVARAAALGGLGAAGAVLAKRAMKPGGGACSNRGVCPACGELAGCQLPQARLTRRARPGRG